MVVLLAEWDLYFVKYGRQIKFDLVKAAPSAPGVLEEIWASLPQPAEDISTRGLPLAGTLPLSLAKTELLRWLNERCYINVSSPYSSP